MNGRSTVRISCCPYSVATDMTLCLELLPHISPRLIPTYCNVIVELLNRQTASKKVRLRAPARFIRAEASTEEGKGATRGG